MLDFKACFNFRCFFSNGDSVDHYQELYLKDISTWIQAYKFTHPGCICICVNVRFDVEEAAK